MTVFVRCILRGQSTQPNAVADTLLLIDQVDPNHRAGACKLCIRRVQVHRQAPQGAVADVHAHQSAACKQKGQQVAQVQLVVN